MSEAVEQQDEETKDSSYYLTRVVLGAVVSISTVGHLMERYANHALEGRIGLEVLDWVFLTGFVLLTTITGALMARYHQSK